MNDMEHLDRLLTTYAALAGVRLSTAYLRATKSGDTIRRIRAGRPMTIQRAARIVQWLSDHWPADADLDWPSDISRPAPRTEEESTAA